ncbi:MAG TPA: 50S ribosomal protein L6 [Candidatus Brocadiia bacterium]|nr:50S ribosomal protein L6 [Candidatus Brocadiia bacterium]
MSRIGKNPIPVPAGVKVSVSGQAVAVEGPKGKLTRQVNQEIKVEWDDKGRALKLTRSDDLQQNRALHGLNRALLANMVKGVSDGFQKGLEVHGTGYQAKMEGKDLVLLVGFNHPVRKPVPEGLKVQVTQPTAPGRIIVDGCDKQLVGQFAAEVRHIKPVEPYQGKGIRYANEAVRRKAGKAFGALGR